MASLGGNVLNVDDKNWLVIQKHCALLSLPLVQQSQYWDRRRCLNTPNQLKFSSDSVSLNPRKPRYIRLGEPGAACSSLFGFFPRPCAVFAGTCQGSFRHVLSWLKRLPDRLKPNRLEFRLGVANLIEHLLPHLIGWSGDPIFSFATKSFSFRVLFTSKIMGS